ncbi:MAG: cobalamin-dependent protein [Eubacteriales bacterium]
MKILLARPPAPNKLSFTGVLDNEPLELEYLHTALQANGYEDYLFDGMVEQVRFERVLRREQPDVVAITGYIAQENQMKRFALAAKKYNPAIVTIVGGVHAQLNYRRFECPQIDYIARSEGMDAWIDLIRYIDTGAGELGAINGLCYRHGEDYTESPLTPSDINRLPIPDRAHFYKYRHRYRYLDLTPLAVVKTALSCPYQCNFCYCTLLNGGHYHARDIERVVDEIEGIDCPHIQIVDDDFLVDRARILRFVALIKERGIQKKYICYTRADFAAHNPDIIELLADIGFTYFLVGLEATSDEALSSLNKKTTDEINRACVANINRTKGHCIGMFIVGIDATPADFQAIVDWVESTGLQYVTASMFTPIPGTPLYEENRHLITSRRIEDWDFLHLVMKPTRMSPSRYYYHYYKMFLRFYQIARKAGIYDFLDAKFYFRMIARYLKRKMLGV